MNEIPGEDRRHFHRIPLRRDATVYAGSAQHSCQIADVSLKGALLAPASGWSANKGDKVSLDIQLDSPGDATIHMQGHVAHVEDGQVGIECHQMDLDSATLLRRVVELNLADPDLLERELVAMIDAA